MYTAVSQLRSDQLVPLHHHAHFIYPACLFFLYTAVDQRHMCAPHTCIHQPNNVVCMCLLLHACTSDRDSSSAGTARQSSVTGWGIRSDPAPPAVQYNCKCSHPHTISVYFSFIYRVQQETSHTYSKCQPPIIQQMSVTDTT
jgi:hypothetical protein